MKILQMTIEKEMPEVWEMKRLGIVPGRPYPQRERAKALQPGARVMPHTGKQELLSQQHRSW